MLWTTLPRRRPLLGCWTIKLSCEAFWEALSPKRILHSLLWEKHAKELGILIFKLINESEREFLTTAMKIYLTKKKTETALNKISENPESSGNFSFLKNAVFVKICFFEKADEILYKHLCTSLYFGKDEAYKIQLILL